MSSCDTDIWIYIPRLVFDPFDLALDVTPANVVAALDRRDFLQALVLAFRLTEAELIQKVVEATPHTDIVLLAQTMPSNYVQPMLVFLAKELDHSRHVGTC
eukprot:m.165163 g.165163  ORF g.165163 m.165163 type:complete len:101 (-) comp16589_c1_seq5:1406-1708(-)